jgi:hypothetical protein
MGEASADAGRASSGPVTIDVVPDAVMMDEDPTAGPTDPTKLN